MSKITLYNLRPNIQAYKDEQTNNIVVVAFLGGGVIVPVYEITREEYSNGSYHEKLRERIVTFHMNHKCPYDFLPIYPCESDIND